MKHIALTVSIFSACRRLGVAAGQHQRRPGQRSRFVGCRDSRRVGDADRLRHQRRAENRHQQRRSFCLSRHHSRPVPDYRRIARNAAFRGTLTVQVQVDAEINATLKVGADDHAGRGPGRDSPGADRFAYARANSWSASGSSNCRSTDAAIRTCWSRFPASPGRTRVSESARWCAVTACRADRPR